MCYMKKLITLVLLFIQMTIVMGQAPKYVLLEHFTNTNCGICGGVNPTFYQNIAINTNAKVHHLSIHSSVPYTACVFYQANKAEQDARATYYNIPGTPRVSINGTNTTSASNISSTTIDNNFCTNCSPLEVKVTETSGMNRTASVQLKSIGTPPSGTHRVYVALVEKIVNYDAPNSEKVHHNVFRRFLTASNGDAVALPTQGNSVNLDFNYTVAAAWAAAEVYAIVWVQTDGTNAVINSGTRFDVSSLPVELVQWSGKSEQQKNVLNWATASESNSSHFEIERSNNSQKFVSIGQVKAAGQSSQKQLYSFNDANPLPLAYYRLKQVDLDQKVEYSSVITLKKQNGVFKINNLYPSVVKDKLTLDVTTPKSKTLELSIVDVLGRSIWSKQMLDFEGDLIETIDVEKLNSGIYFLHIQNQESVLNQQFIKQ
jgi:Outer membrane protein Omp28/Secretion system C-terminal sorting domain